MFQRVYYVDKSSGTFADALQAFGAAFIIRHLLRHGIGDAADVRLVDEGQAYALELSEPLLEEYVQRCPFFVGAPFLLTPKNLKKLPQDVPLDTPSVVDYQAQKERRAEFFELLKGLSREARAARARGQEHAELEALRGTAVHEHWDIFRALNPGALDAYNSCAAAWHEGRGAFCELVDALLLLIASTPNDLEGSEHAWAETCRARGWSKPKPATASQILNPAQGKGQNRPKADGAAMQNLKGFWLPEYLKAVGMYQAGLTRIVANPRDPRNAKDRKTYVLAPLDITFGVHEDIMQRFRRAMEGSSTAVKLDILSALRYARAFLDYTESGRRHSVAEQWFNKRPGDLVAGLQMAFYKNLGNSSATMNIAMINLPGWVRAGAPDETVRFKSVLEEHETIVRVLDETHSDAFDLLVRYRDFVSGNDLRPFFEFAVAYSGYQMGHRERGKWCPSFTTTGLEVLLMNTDQQLSRIVESQGFRNIAYAIRHSTVVPQGRKARNLDHLEIRYGLGQRLARKAGYPKDFVSELTEFLLEYNAENEQQFERRKVRYRKGVRTDDIDAIVELVDEFGPKVVCNLLVAYGYARTPRAGDDAAGEPTAEQPAPGDESLDEGDESHEE